MQLLNLGIIKFRLSTEPEAICGDIYHDMVLHSVRLMSSETRHKYSTDHLYVMHWEQRPDSVVYPPYMICVGGGEEAKAFFQ